MRSQKLIRSKKLTPRDLRAGIRDKKYKIVSIPSAPQEWKEYRRGRMEVAIFFSVYWLRGMDAQEICKKLRMPNGISKQRAHQYVIKGCQYLIDHKALSGI